MTTRTPHCFDRAMVCQTRSAIDFERDETETFALSLYIPALPSVFRMDNGNCGHWKDGRASTEQSRLVTIRNGPGLAHLWRRSRRPTLLSVIGDYKSQPRSASSSLDLS